MGKKTNFLLGQSYKPINYWSMIYVLGFIMGKKKNYMLDQPYKPDNYWSMIYVLGFIISEIFL